MAHATKTLLCAIVLASASSCSPTPREPVESRAQPLAPKGIHAQPRAPEESHAEPPAPKERHAQPVSPIATPGSACDEAQLELRLSAPHDPPTRDELVQVCSEPVNRLSQIAKDTSRRGLLRLRALEALGALGGPEALRVLEELAGASGDLASVRRTALTALGQASAPGGVERERAGMAALSDPDPHVRAAAARLLSGTKSPAAVSALERARTRETEPFVREQIESSQAGH
jgi:hypothetical protein